MYENNRFKQRERSTDEDHDWIKDNYKQFGFSSAAAFLEHIIKEFKEPNLFKKQKK